MAAPDDDNIEFDVILENYDYHDGKDKNGRNLQEVFQDSVNIKTVKILNCHLKAFPHELLERENLKALYVHRCSFEGPPVCGEVGQYLNLEYLCLSECGFKCFPSGIATLARVRKVLLGNKRRCPGMWKNALNYIHKGLADLSSLEHLDISWCMLPNCSPVLNELKTIRHLVLTGNFYIEAISTSLLESLTHLEHLDVTYCGLSKFPEFPPGMDSLSYLNISVNQISTLNPTVRNLKNLKTFILDSCEFTTFPKEIFHMKSLQEIDMSGNPIVELPGSLKESLGKLKYLKVLKLPHNKEEEFDELKELPTPIPAR